MPHYKDGTGAKVGDTVRGASYNRGGVEEEGVLVQITADSDVCNCKVWFPMRPPKDADGNVRNDVPWVKENGYAPEGVDYGELRAFELIRDPLGAFEQS